VFTLDASVRDKSGKGAARRARSAGMVPAVVYGPGKEAMSVSVEPRALGKALTGPKKRNAVLTLNLKDAAGKSHGSRTVVVKDLQMHVVRRTPTHIDFLEVAADRPISFKVPVEVTGKSKAVADGGKTNLVVRTVTVLAKPNDVPVTIGYDVTDQGFGVVRAKQLTLPPGLTLLDSPDMPVISVRVPRQEKEEEVAAATPAEGAAAAEGAAPAAAKAGDAKGAAPAADAKAAGGDKKK
jgi:large subunit ribosomal protein L25